MVRCDLQVMTFAETLWLPACGALRIAQLATLASPGGRVVNFQAPGAEEVN